MSNNQPHLIQLGERRRLFCCNETSNSRNQYPFFIKVWDAEKAGHYVYFPPPRWLALTQIINAIDEELHLIQQGTVLYNSRHIGGGLYVNLKHPFNIVDLRMKVFDERLKEEVHSDTGVTLDPKEWSDLKNCISYVEEQFPEILQMRPCYEEDSHMNQLGMMQCLECSPFASYHEFFSPNFASQTHL